MPSEDLSDLLGSLSLKPTSHCSDTTADAPTSVPVAAPAAPLSVSPVLPVLRPYQEKLVRKFMKKTTKSGKKAVLLHLPTGGGKTIISASIMHNFCELQKRRCLFVVNRNELIDQTARCLCSFGLKHQIGYIKAGYAADPTKPIQIASIQTLRPRLESNDCPPTDLIVIDEAHCAISASYMQLLRHFPSATVLGLTATPYRMCVEEQRILFGMVFDARIKGPSIKELTDGGHLTPSRCFGFHEDSLGDMRSKTSKDSVQDFLKKVVNHDIC
jgi:superfamily II DNA or RNA helicase